MDAFSHALVVFFVVIDPPGLVPIFMALTQGFDAERKRLIALRGTALSLAILVFFAYLGEPVLNALGIGMPALRISGGVLLFWIAFEMLFERRNDRKEQAVGRVRSLQEARDVAVFPLAIPLIAGPGTITSTLLMFEQHGGDMSGQLTVLLAAGLVIASVTVLLVGAEVVDRVLGRTVISTLGRVLGIVLAALATQSIISGIVAIYPPG